MINRDEKLNILKGFWSSQLLFEKMGKYFEENNLMVWELKKKILKESNIFAN